MNSMSTVVIDPGHGGSVKVGRSSPNNATGPRGTKEKDLTLDIGLKTRDFLRSHQINTILTRDSDINLGIDDRVLIAKNASALVFLSIHFNGDPVPTVQGTETWVSHKEASNSISMKLARSVQQSVTAVTGYHDRKIRQEKPDPSGVLDPEKHFFDTSISLVEISFLTDPNDEIRLTTPITGDQYKLRLAEALSLAICSHLQNL